MDDQNLPIDTSSANNRFGDLALDWTPLLGSTVPLVKRLMIMPDEIVIAIIENLDLKSLFTMCHTSSAFRSFVKLNGGTLYRIMVFAKLCSVDAMEIFHLQRNGQWLVPGDYLHLGILDVVSFDNTDFYGSLNRYNILTTHSPTYFCNKDPDFLYLLEQSSVLDNLQLHVRRHRTLMEKYAILMAAEVVDEKAMMKVQEEIVLADNWLFREVLRDTQMILEKKRRKMKEIIWWIGVPKPRGAAKGKKRKKARRPKKITRRHCGTV